MHLTTTERVVILYITAVTAVSGLFRGEPTETIGDDCHSVLQSQQSQGCSEENLQRQLETTVIVYSVTEVSGLFREEPTETIGDDCHSVLQSQKSQGCSEKNLQRQLETTVILYCSHRSLRVVEWICFVVCYGSVTESTQRFNC